MKTSKLTYALPLILILLSLNHVSAFQSCLFRDPNQWQYTLTGFAKGIKGSLITTTDCLSTVQEILTTISRFIASL